MPGPAEPFAIGNGPDACLLLHGLTGSPAELRPVGEALARAGIHALAPLLPGHGTRPEDLEGVTRHDLLEAGKSALISLRGARRLYLCGLSAGALVSIHLAGRGFSREGLPDLSGLALLAPAVQFAGLTWVFANVVGRLPAIPIIIGKGKRDLRAPTGTRADGSYSAVPMRWGAELRALSADAQRLAHRVRTRTLILHGALDRTASPAGARRLAQKLGSTKVELQILARSGHVLPLDVEGEAVCDRVVSFFQQGEV